MAARKERRSFWTWGYQSDEPSENERRAAAERISRRTGRASEPPPIPDVDAIKLRLPRVKIPGKLEEFVSTSQVERITHTHGGHSLELLAALRGIFDNPPDAVAHPRNEDELEAVLEWCDNSEHAVIPYGGGTSVVWGVNAPLDRDTAVTVDLDEMNAVLELDETSRAGRFQAGMLGPDVEATLKPHG